MTAHGMTVGELRDRLAAFPDYRPVVVEITVGGDLVTDTVDLAEVRADGHDTAYVLLRPAPDEYDVRALIDDGLAYREEQREKLPPSGDSAVANRLT